MKKIFKKSVSVFLVLVLSLCMFSIIGSAASKSDLVYTVENGSATLVKCDQNAKGTVVVPSVATIKGVAYNVTSIGAGAFENCAEITSISLAEGIKTIGSRAFANCVSLEDVYVPESLTFCQYTAFNGCASVMLHCYSSNIQLFTVYGINVNLKLDVIDSEDDSILPGGSSGSSDSMLANTIVDLIRKIIVAILNLFINFAK